MGYGTGPHSLHTIMIAICFSNPNLITASKSSKKVDIGYRYYDKNFLPLFLFLPHFTSEAATFRLELTGAVEALTRETSKTTS